MMHGSGGRAGGDRLLLLRVDASRMHPHAERFAAGEGDAVFSKTILALNTDLSLPQQKLLPADDAFG